MSDDRPPSPADGPQTNSRPPSPLDGLLVIEFGSLVPGPMTSLFLAEAGARVIKIERPPAGDAMRAYEPKILNDSGQFHLLNRGKTSLFVDLKDAAARAELVPLLSAADVVIEQFRPGVMDRLSLGFEAIKALNPRVIYCSLSGWGQSGPKAHKAAHDLNFLAESGFLDQIRGKDGDPALPHVLTSDIAGGVYPAVVNILLAVLQRQQTGQGMHLDIAIADGLGIFGYDRLVPAMLNGVWPDPGKDLCTGGSPRYQIYKTADARFLAVAAIEDRFWHRFCDMIGLEPDLRDDRADPALVKSIVSSMITVRTSTEWQDLLNGNDCCCSVVATFEEALQDPHMIERGLYARTIGIGSLRMPVLPIPIADMFRSARAMTPIP